MCPLARAAEIVAERWTLLIVRELLLGAWRFSDLRRRLGDISPSVLTERLENLELKGLIEQRELPPPAASSVYELTALGLTLKPVVMELGRFGLRFLEFVENDHFELDWTRMALPVCAKRSPSAAFKFVVHLQINDQVYSYHIKGGNTGTKVKEGVGASDAILTIKAEVVPALLSRMMDLEQAERMEAVEIVGDKAKAYQLFTLFEQPGSPLPDPREEM